MAKQRLQWVLAFLSYYLGGNKLFYHLNRNRKKIVSYHNIIPDDFYEGVLHEGVSHCESTFESHVALMKKRGAIGLELDDPQQITITFDDGYLNQYLLTKPILEQHQAKAYFFCTLDLLDGVAPLIIDDLMMWVSYIPCGTYDIGNEFSELGTQISIQNELDRRELWAKVFQLVAKDCDVASRIKTSFDRAYAYEGIRDHIDAAYYELRFTSLREEELADMVSSGHKVGAHAKSHLVMSSLEDEALKVEVSQCSERVGKVFNCDTFSFPFGGLLEVTRRETQEVQQNGFSRALANINQPLEGVDYSQHFMPRLDLPNTTSVVMNDFVLSGVKYFLQHRKLFPIIK